MLPKHFQAFALAACVLAVASASCEDGPESPGGASDQGAMATANDAAASGMNGSCFEDAKGLTLVTVLSQDPSGFIGTPHEVELLDATTGLPFTPAFKTTSGKGTGEISFDKVPCGTRAWIHTKGVGAAADSKSTYDSLNLFVPRSGEKLVRISTSGTAASAEATGGFVGKADQVGVGGAVYSVDGNGKHTGTVGCATIHIDDQPHPATRYDQRYVASTGLPTSLEKQTQTLTSGKFYFGNLPPGKHTFRVSLDKGQTFLGEPLELVLPFARKDAAGEFKNVLVLFEIGIPGPNPTPKGCQ